MPIVRSGGRGKWMIIIVQLLFGAGFCPVGPTATDGPRVTIQNFSAFFFDGAAPIRS